MSVQTKEMSSIVFLFLNLVFLVSHNDIKASHVDKPMIYINFFDEVVTNNVSSTNIMDKVVSTTLTPSNASTNGTRKKHDLLADLPKLNNDNKTSGSWDAMFEFDMPSKADITEMSVNESDGKSLTTTEFSDMMDPEFLEPELTRMFFMKAIANLLEHIMVALFSVDEPPKLNEPQDFDYVSAPSRNIKKRDLFNSGDVAKLSDVDQHLGKNPELKTNFSSVSATSKTVTSQSSNENETTEHIASSDLTHKSDHLKINNKFSESVTEHSSSSPLVLISDHISTAASKLHSIKRENEAKSTAGGHKTGNDLVGNHVKLGKPISYKNLPTDEENVKMLHFSAQNTLLNDELENKKDTRFYEGIHPAEDHDRIVENFANKGHDSNDSSFFVATFLVGTTVLIIMLLGALALAVVYLFRKSHEVQNQNATNLQSAIA